MLYHMQFLQISLPSQKHGLSCAIYGIYFLSPKTWTIIYNFKNFFPFFKNMDYHMHFLEFLSLLKKCCLAYAIFANFFPFYKNVDCDKQFLEFHSLFQKIW